jgi:hypothetical protein
LAWSGLKRAIRFATYDWTRELPLSLRVITMIGMGIQGYAIWAALTRSLIWPIMWPSGVILYATILLIYYVGFCIQNATLASELIRKTQLESEQFAAQKIQKTLQPTTIDEIRVTKSTRSTSRCVPWAATTSTSSTCAAIARSSWWPTCPARAWRPHCWRPTFRRWCGACRR